MEPTKSPYIEVRESIIHNKGIFAAKDIPKGTHVIEYVGEKVTKEESDIREIMHKEASKKDPAKGVVYMFELNDKYDIDGEVPYNTAKYINHSCDPNCEIIYVGEHIWVVACRDIKQGEEVTYNYGFDLEDFKDYPCRCGSKNCVGYILAEEDWPELKNMIKKQESSG
jgi:SET domain-containing protein